MKIESNYSYIYNVSMHGAPKVPNDKFLDRIIKKIEQRIINTIPEKTFKDSKLLTDKFEKCVKVITRPDVNRVIMGVAALATQPAIDYYNHRVDEETRYVSRNRTIAKIIACTSVGAVVRGSCYKLVDLLTKANSPKKYSKWLLPKQFIETLKKEPTKLANYKNALSTMVALLVMTFTNFLLDAPLTLLFTNKLNERTAKKRQEKEVKNG